MTRVVKVAHQVIVTFECYCSYLCLVVSQFVLSDINPGIVELTFNSNLNDLNVISTLYMVILTKNKVW